MDPQQVAGCFEQAGWQPLGALSAQFLLSGNSADIVGSTVISLLGRLAVREESSRLETTTNGD
jgi:hypothetical protein